MSKPVSSRIKDKISLFERPGVQASQTPRSADTSPVRKTTDKLKANFLLADQRSHSAERYNNGRSGSASPGTERHLTIKERARNFAEASKTGNRGAVLPKRAMTQKPTLSPDDTESKSPELDNQGKLDVNQQTQATTVSEITLKPDGRDTTADEGDITIPKEQRKDSKTKDTVAVKATEQETKPNSVEANGSPKELEDPVNVTDDINQQSKGPSRTGSRSKKRRSREQGRSVSPKSEDKPESAAAETETSAVKAGQVDGAVEAVSASAQPTADTSLSSKTDGGSEQPPTETKENASKKQLEVADKVKKQPGSSFEKEKIPELVNRQDSEPAVNRDELDTAASSSGTKTPIDKELDILPRKEEKEGGHSLPLTQEKEKASEDSRETPASTPSPAAEQPTDRTSSKQQELPVKPPKADKERSETENKGKAQKDGGKDTRQTHNQQQKSTAVIDKTGGKEAAELKKTESDKTKSGKEKTQQSMHSDKTTAKVKVSNNGAKEGSVAKGSERKDPEKKGEMFNDQSETKEKTSDAATQKQHSQQATATSPQQSAAVCAVAQTNEGAASGTKGDTQPLKGDTKAQNVPRELQTKSNTESTGTATAAVAAEPQSVEKMASAPDDSCAHGANDAESSSTKPITKATAAAQRVTVKAENESPRADGVAKKEEPRAKEAPLIAVPTSVKSEGAELKAGEEKTGIKSVTSEVKSSGVVSKPAAGLPQSGKNTASSSDVTSLKGVEKVAQQPPAVSAGSGSSISLAEKTSHSAMNELSPAANGNLAGPHPERRMVKTEPVKGKPSQTPKAPTLPEANKLIPSSMQHSAMKKLHLPRGLSRDDSEMRQDAPSSWLDVDLPRQRFKAPMRRLSNSSSESNLLDTSGELDDEDFIEKIKNLCAPFSLPPRKHNPMRTPQPPFAMPAIKEDHFEKTFDPDEFTFGLRKQKFATDIGPSMLAKLQNMEVKAGLKPARASLADRSMLISSLDVHSRLKEKTPDKEGEEEAKEEKEEPVRVKSRLEGSCVFSGLTSKLRGKKDEVQAQEEASPETQPSPPPSSQAPPPSPSPPASAPLRDSEAKQSPPPGHEEEAPAAASDSCPPLPSFNDIKLPDYLEKYLPGDRAKPGQNIQGQEQVKSEVSFTFLLLFPS